MIELRDKNIKGEQLMSALKEFGIDSLVGTGRDFSKVDCGEKPEFVGKTKIKEV